jgi:subtilisin family serine protease
MRRYWAPSSKLSAALIAAVLLGLPLKVHTQDPPATLSEDLVAFLESGSSAKVRVITTGAPGSSLISSILGLGINILKPIQNGAVLEVNRAQLEALRNNSAVSHLSGDVPVVPTMVVSSEATGADQVHDGWNGGTLGLVSYAGVTGKGVGIAVIDSGISGHPAVTPGMAASIDLATNASGTADGFGHGTHVAGIIAGRAGVGASALSHFDGGIAPEARLINVRVLDGRGVGYTSDVLAGLDWAIANRQKYNIRVINLSLGHPVQESSTTDPLCHAVTRAVAAGITVVASAGNMGRDKDGSQVLGGISSPGSCPAAITVGAVSTQNTAARGDDTLASYSSRGPTKYDFAIKPDLVAPGTRIVAPQAKGSWLATNYTSPTVAGVPSNAYMALSGTSMAAAVVSGGVALLVQANPYLTPQQIKLALQSTATFMPKPGLVGAGAGSVNFRAARQSASAGLLNIATKIAGQVLTAGGVSYWDAGALIDRVYEGTGIEPLGVLEAVQTWLNPAKLVWGNLNLLGLKNPIGAIAPNYIVWGEMAGWSSSYYIVWGETFTDPEGQYIVWGENGDGYIVWGETFVPDMQ